MAHFPNLVEIAFEGQSKLESIESSAFRNCKFLKSITIPASVVRIISGAFDDSTLEEFICTNDSNLKVIESDVFENCNSLKIIKLPSKSVKIIGNFSLPSLEEIVFGDCKQSQTREKMNTLFNFAKKVRFLNVRSI